MPTILDALKIKDGGNTPANTITDFLRAHNDAPLTNGDVTIASYIANSPVYDPVAPVPSNDSQGLVKTMLSDTTSRTYNVLTKSYTKKYKDIDLHGLYYFSVSNSPSSVPYPEEDEEICFEIKDVNDVIYRVPGAYTKAGSGISITTFIDSEIIPNKDKIGAYLYGHMSKATKPVQMLLVSIPGETADQITIKTFRCYKIKKL